MAESNVFKNWLKKNGHKLEIMYSYAVVNKLKIESREDVLKILREVDPEDANEEQIGMYSKMLLLFRRRLRSQLGKS